MLHCGGDNVFSALAQPAGGALDGPVVGLGAAGGEEHPIWFSTHSGGNLAPCIA